MLQTESRSTDVVIQIGPPGETQIFTLSEARAVLPWVQQITHNASEELQPVKDQLQRLLECDPRSELISRQYEEIVRRWIGKIERLGLVAKGLWWVSFDTGEGYLCWRYPEIRLDYFHDYDEPVECRRPIADLCLDYPPEWTN